MADSVENYIANIEDNALRSLVEYLDKMLMMNPGVVSKIRYRVPFYYRHSWFCYINPLKEGGIELAFTRGNELSNMEGILEAHDRKQVQGIRLKPGEDFPEDIIHMVIQEALLLDESIPYASKRKKKS